VACIRAWLADRPAELGVEPAEDCIPADGDDITIDGRVTLTTNTRCDRATPEAPAWPVTAATGAAVTLDEAPVGLAVGDEVLLLTAQGAGAGTWALTTVRGLDGAVVTLAAAVDAPTVLQRVPRYGDVTVGSAGVLTARAWDGSTGGVLAFRATGAVRVASGGRVDMAGRGYAGGPTGPSYNADGYQGESYAGVGIGGVSYVSYYNEAIGAWAANLGGGGANIGGGGGEHAGGATAGVSWDGVAHAPEAGGTYGTAELTSLFLGSGGGGVANIAGAPGPGGAGGGIILVFADTLEVDGTVTAAGEAATARAAKRFTEPATARRWASHGVERVKAGFRSGSRSLKTSDRRRAGAVAPSSSRGGLLHGHPLPPCRHLRQQRRGRCPRVVAAGLKHPLQLAGRVYRHPAGTAEKTFGTRERLAVE